MKLCRFGEAGRERPGVIDAVGRICDMSAHVGDLGPAEIAPAALRALSAIAIDDLPLAPEGVRYGPLVTGTRKFIAMA